MTLNRVSSTKFNERVAKRAEQDQTARILHLQKSIDSGQPARIAQADLSRNLFANGQFSA